MVKERCEKNLFEIIKNMIFKTIYNGEKYATRYAIKIAREKGVTVGENCRFYSTKFSSEPYLIEIGDHVTLAEGVKLITHDGSTWVLRGLSKEYQNCNLVGKITIGNNVFIGIDSILLPGVSLGNNTVVAAGSIVTKSFPDNVVIAGSPAKIIKTLDEYIQLNKESFVNTKGLSTSERRNYIIKSMNENQFRNR